MALVSPYMLPIISGTRQPRVGIGGWSSYLLKTRRMVERIRQTPIPGPHAFCLAETCCDTRQMEKGTERPCRRSSTSIPPTGITGNLTANQNADHPQQSYEPGHTVSCFRSPFCCTGVSNQLNQLLCFFLHQRIPYCRKIRRWQQTKLKTQKDATYIFRGKIRQCYP